MKHIFKEDSIKEDSIDATHYKGTALCGKENVHFNVYEWNLGYFLYELRSRNSPFFNEFKVIKPCQKCLNHPSTLLHLLKIL